MDSLINIIRTVIGTTGAEAHSSYGELMEYTIAGMLVILVVAGVFKILINLSKR